MSSPSPRKNRIKPTPKQEATSTNSPPTPPPEMSLFENPPLTPTELVEGLSKVVAELQTLLDNPSSKQPTKELTEQMEKIRQMSSFLSAVYANMIRIAVEEEKVTPEPPNEEQKALAARTETLGWTLRALQEKASIRMNPPASSPKPPASAKKRKSRMERTQGDKEWKRM